MVEVELGHGPSRLPPRWLVASGPQVQIDPAALELELVGLALAVVLAAGLEGQHLEFAGEALELGQQVSYRHLRSVARQALYVVLSGCANWLNRSDRKAHGTPGDQRLVDLGGELDNGVGQWSRGEGI